MASYAAFVQREAGSSSAFVPLGTATSIEALVRAWRDEASGRMILAGASMRQAENTYRTTAQRLRDVVWAPLSSYLAGAIRVFVVPDGLLNVVSIAALPSRGGRYAVEGQPVLHYLSTERDLVSADLDSSQQALLAVGGAAFGPPSTAPATAPRLTRCADFSRLYFPQLPGTRTEIVEISRLWPSQDRGSSTILTGSAATETAVKRALSGQRVVHLATHGFFIGGECRSGTGETRGVGGLAQASKAAGPASDNPLLLTGLAFAGANRHRLVRADQDDGILTAEEVAGLNLQGTQWAVLSACGTGLGEIRAGEGVLGLRRAFQIAGARTVIMSLWSVDDQATRAWMRALYEGRLNKGLDTADAVRDASLAVLRARRARGQSTHPFYWAAFVAAGDWR